MALVTPAADISVNAARDEYTDLAEVKQLGREAVKTWSEAQTTESRLKMSGTEQVEMSGFARFFPRLKKRNYKIRTARVERTNLTEQNYDRRVLVTTSYDDALGIDRDDLMDSGMDVFADAMGEQKKAQGRICDSIVLYAQHAVTYSVKSANETNLSSPLGESYDIATFLDSLTKNYQINLYHKGLGTGAKIKAFEADDLELVIHQFRKRLVSDEIVCALTPDFSHTLRTNVEFKNTENRFNPSEQYQSGMYTGFMFHGIRMLPVLDDVLVKPNDRYLGVKEAGTIPTRTTDEAIAAAETIASHVVARNINDADTRAPLESETASTIVLDSDGTTIGAVTVAGDAIDANSKISLIKQDLVEQSIVHFWVPRSLKFASRSAGIWSRRTDRGDLKHAEQLYSRINFGCLNVDSNYSVGLITKGTAVKGKIT